MFKTVTIIGVTTVALIELLAQDVTSLFWRLTAYVISVLDFFWKWNLAEHAFTLTPKNRRQYAENKDEYLSVKTVVIVGNYNTITFKWNNLLLTVTIGNATN